MTEIPSPTAALPRQTVRPPLSEAHADVALADINDLVTLTRLGRSWLHEAVRKGEFPAPVIRQPRCTRWKLADIRQWLIERVAKAETDTRAGLEMTERAKKASATAQAKRRSLKKDPV